MNVLLGGLVTLLVVWADDFRFRWRELGWLLLIFTILQIHSYIVRRETLAALEKELRAKGSITQTLRNLDA